MNHLWTMICSFAVIDRETNNVSLLNIIEQLHITGEPVENGLLPVNIDVITLWEKEQDDEQQTRSRLSLFAPDGIVLGQWEAEVNFEQFSRNRAKITFQGFPIPQAGTYLYVVETISEAGEWYQVANVPIQVNFTGPATTREA
jgi:hypothetical protein